MKLHLLCGVSEFVTPSWSPLVTHDRPRLRWPIHETGAGSVDFDRGVARHAVGLLAVDLLSAERNQTQGAYKCLESSVVNDLRVCCSFIQSHAAQGR